jgi:hypothetical protein
VAHQLNILHSSPLAFCFFIAAQQLIVSMAEYQRTIYIAAQQLIVSIAAP